MFGFSNLLAASPVCFDPASMICNIVLWAMKDPTELDPTCTSSSCFARVDVMKDHGHASHPISNYKVITKVTVVFN